MATHTPQLNASKLGLTVRNWRLQNDDSHSISKGSNMATNIPELKTSKKAT